MKQTLRLLPSIFLLLSATVPGVAQPSAHYVPGIEGIRGATLPPPGVYFRDYNVFYFANRVNDGRGREIAAADARAFVYANVPRVIWITDLQILGGNIGVDALVPLQYTDLAFNQPPPAGRFDESTFGIGDVFGEVTWSRHLDRVSLALGYGVWAPTGDFSTTNPTRAGSGFWTHMLTAGVTFHLDGAKRWALSALNRYEISHDTRGLDLTPGQAYTLEWGLSHVLRETIDVGVVGYYQGQTTRDRGDDAMATDRDHVVGVGPEVVLLCPKLRLFTSLRYNYEVLAENRLQGHTVAVTFTHRF
jgi:hypothetical protein